MSIKLENISYTYGIGTPYEKQALKDISFEIEQGEFIGVIGHTGSGKSTLIQQFNGLEKAHSGKLYVQGHDVYSKDYDLKGLRNTVGLVFQYPEHQLFEEDVLKDVCFGPLNQGYTSEEAISKAKKALKMVGLSEEFYTHSPFDLSGGQKRRVAIAGVLAMEPEILVLDEPTAGLDPMGREEILGLISRLHKEYAMTVILVSHSMEDVGRFVSKLLVLNKGEVMYYDTPKEVFKEYKKLEEMGLAAPQITYILQGLKEKGISVATHAITIEEGIDSILAYRKQSANTQKNKPMQEFESKEEGK